MWLSSDKDARFFVRTQAGDRFTIILSGVEALNFSGIRAGNIILDLVFIASDKLTVKQIEDAYGLESAQVEMSHRLQEKAQEQGLSGIEISSSYGAEGTVLFHAFDTVTEHVLP